MANCLDWPLPSRSLLIFIWSPSTVPLYKILIEFPPASNVVENEIWFPDTFPSCRGTSPEPKVMVPLSLSPSTLNVKVVGTISPPRPGLSPDHLPDISAAIVTPSDTKSRQLVRTALLIRIQKLLCDKVLYSSSPFYASGMAGGKSIG